jgi:Tol biopolymer transport system component
MSRFRVLCLLTLAVTLASGCSRDKPATHATPATAVAGEIGYSDGPVFASSTPLGRPAAAPTPTPPARVPVTQLPPGAQPGEAGSFLLDVPSGRVSKVSELTGGVWSPDGTSLAFRQCCNGGAGLIDILDVASGTTVRVPTGDARDLAWSPDSIHLAYVAMDKNLAGLGVYIVDRDGYNPHVVIKDAGAGEPRWLDERRVAYSKGNQGYLPTFFVVDVSRPNVNKRLVEKDPPDANDPRIVFGFASTDGLWVVYYEGNYHSDQGQTLAWNSRTGEVRLLLPSLALAEFAPGTHTARIFLPDPDRTGLSRNQVFDLDAGTSAKPLLGVDSHWSGDGKRLVYETYPCQDAATTGPPGVFSALADGKDVHDVSANTAEVEYGYAVSPAQPLVAYTSVTQGAPTSWRLRVRALDGAPRLDLAPSLQPHVEAGAWSPDGRYLLFSLGTGQGVCG